jgi:hypothetical protein
MGPQPLIREENSTIKLEQKAPARKQMIKTRYTNASLYFLRNISSEKKQSARLYW